NLEFSGRIDHQVKIRGFRIELGEIENSLLQLEAVDSALVLARDNGTDKQLIAYVKLSLTREMNLTEIKHSLVKILPVYMLPDVFIEVTKWPLTQNGKMDVKGLPSPSEQWVEGEYISPQGETEVILVQIWAELLDLDVSSISAKANFFELGGYSLLAVRLGAILRQKLGVSVPVRVIFENGTITTLAHYIDQVNCEHCEYGISTLALDTPQPPIFIAPALGVMGISYHSFASKLSAFFQPFLLTTPGIDDYTNDVNTILNYDFDQRLEQWFNAIVQTQNSGIYRLLGHSRGGDVVFGLARMLESKGKLVEIVLIDSLLDLPHKKDFKEDQDQNFQYLTELANTDNEIHSTKLLSKLLSQFSLGTKNILDDVSAIEMKTYARAMLKQLELSHKFSESQKISAPVLLVMANKGINIANDKREIIERIESWCTSDFDYYSLKGDHKTVINNPELIVRLNSFFS
ncbi:MAG: thioesterase domain-containing protein/acyl carrier protein, partial [Bacteroidia bacterium]